MQTETVVSAKMETAMPAKTVTAVTEKTIVFVTGSPTATTGAAKPFATATKSPPSRPDRPR